MLTLRRVSGATQCLAVNVSVVLITGHWLGCVCTLNSVYSYCSIYTSIIIVLAVSVYMAFDVRFDGIRYSS